MVLQLIAENYHKTFQRIREVFDVTKLALNAQSNFHTQYEGIRTIAHLILFYKARFCQIVRSLNENLCVVCIYKSYNNANNKHGFN